MPVSQRFFLSGIFAGIRGARKPGKRRLPLDTVRLGGFLLAFFTALPLVRDARAEKSSRQDSLLGAETCEIFRDAQGVFHALHVAADAALAAGRSVVTGGLGQRNDPQSSKTTRPWACLGYLHGRERGWQMDFLRRAARGRKAELVGYKAIRDDFLMRLLGLGEKAEALWKELEPETRGLFEDYARGVNLGFRELERRPSYAMKRFGQKRLESWRGEDSVLLTLLQAFDQTRKGFAVELEEQQRLGAHGPSAAQQFVEDALPWESTILKPGEYPRHSPRRQEQAPAFAHPDSDKSPRATADPRSVSLGSGAGAELLAALAAPQGVGEIGGLGGGSNNWVLSPGRSSTAKALLANDPHLSLKHPPFWFWVHLEEASSQGDRDEERLDVIGATLPGVPVIVSGSNRWVAWGLTNSYLDAADLGSVPESDLVGEASARFRPWIWFRLGFLQLPFFFKSAERTRRGWPVVPLESEEGRKLVLRWTGFDLTGSDLSSFLKLARVRSARQADQLLSEVGVPSWNFVFADTQGNVGYRAVGRVFKRKQAPAYGIARVSLSEFESYETLGPHEMPQAFNPSRGYIVTANNRHWPRDGVFHGGRAYSRAFRAHRIEELLERRARHDRESTLAIQCDVQSGDARFLLPELLALLKSRLGVASAQLGEVGEEERIRGKSLEKSLGKTSGKSPRKASGQSDFAVRGLALLESWDLEMRTDCQACSLYRRWVDRLLEEQALTEVALYRKLKSDPGSLGTPALEAFRGALAELGEPLPEWGKIHRGFFHHLAGEGVFAREGLATRGDGHTVDPGTADWKPASENKSGGAGLGTYDHHSGASHRLIVEMASPPQVWAILAGSNEDALTPIRSGVKAVGEDPWGRWAECRQDKRVFPLDWSQVNAETVALDRTPADRKK